MPVTAPIAPYMHMLEGRVRIKIPEIKGAHRQALALEHYLRQGEGIHEVTANPKTGSVLILFDSLVLRHPDILIMIQQGGYLRNLPARALPERKNLTHVLFQSAMELAIERLVLALI